MRYEQLVALVCNKGESGDELNDWITDTASALSEQKYGITVMCIRNILSVILSELLSGYEDEIFDPSTAIYQKVSREIRQMMDEELTPKLYRELWIKIYVAKVLEVIPHEIYVSLDKVRRVGNKGAHAEPISKMECQEAVEDLRKILNWYIVGEQEGVDVFTLYQQVQQTGTRKIKEELVELQQEKDRLEEQLFGLKVMIKGSLDVEKKKHFDEKVRLKEMYTNNEQLLREHIAKTEKALNDKIRSIQEEAHLKIQKAEKEIKLAEQKIKEMEEEFSKEREELIEYKMEQSLNALDQGSAGILKAYDQNLLKRIDEESAKEFKARIDMIRRVPLGKAFIPAYVLFESSVVPIEIIWHDPSYTKDDRKYYISFEGVVDPNIIASIPYFDVMGKYTVGDDYCAVPKEDTLQIKIGDNQYEIRTVELKQQWYEKAEVFSTRVQSLGKMPVASMKFDKVSCDKMCGFYLGYFKKLPGAIIDVSVQEGYCFKCDTEIDLLKKPIVYANLTVEDKQITCKDLEIKVGEDYFKLFPQVIDEAFVDTIGMVPLARYSLLEEATDLSTGFIHINVQLENIFMDEVTKDLGCFLFVDKQNHLFQQEGKIYGELVVKGEKVSYKHLIIIYNEQYIPCYPENILSTTTHILEDFIGRKLPIGYFEYKVNGFDRTTGYCPFDIKKWFKWTEHRKFNEFEFCTYMDTLTNPVTKSKNFVYGVLVEEDGVIKFSHLTIHIGEKDYSIYTRRLNRLEGESESEYEKRIGKYTPIGVGRFDKETVDMDVGNAKVIVDIDDWYNGVVPIYAPIYAVAKNQKEKEALLKSGGYTIFSKSGGVYQDQLLPTKGQLTLHVDDAQVELLVLSQEMMTKYLSNPRYASKLTRICAGHIVPDSKEYDAESELFGVDIEWASWCIPYTERLDKGWMRVSPDRAYQLFEYRIAYNVYLVFSDQGVQKVIMLADEEYELGFEALYNMPINPQDIIEVEEEVVLEEAADIEEAIDMEKEQASEVVEIEEATNIEEEQILEVVEVEEATDIEEEQISEVVEVEETADIEEEQVSEVVEIEETSAVKEELALGVVVVPALPKVKKERPLEIVEVLEVAYIEEEVRPEVIEVQEATDIEAEQVSQDVKKSRKSKVIKYLVCLSVCLVLTVLMFQKMKHQEQQLLEKKDEQGLSLENKDSVQNIEEQPKEEVAKEEVTTGEQTEAALTKEEITKQEVVKDEVTKEEQSKEALEKEIQTTEEIVKEEVVKEEPTKEVSVKEESTKEASQKEKATVDKPIGEGSTGDAAKEDKTTKQTSDIDSTLYSNVEFSVYNHYYTEQGKAQKDIVIHNIGWREVEDSIEFLIEYTIYNNVHMSAYTRDPYSYMAVEKYWYKDEGSILKTFKMPKSKIENPNIPDMMISFSTKNVFTNITIVRYQLDRILAACSQ